MAKEIEIKWLNKPEDQSYSAAMSYLSLLYDEPTSTAHVEKIKRAAISMFKSQGYFSSLRSVVVRGEQFSRQKRQEEDKNREGIVATLARKRYSQRKSDHCRWIPSALRSLLVPRGCCDSVQDCVEIGCGMPAG
jgi:hypothetical protein